MQVTFSEGFQLSSAAPKFSSWQHPPSHKFLKQWQWVYFHFHTQPFSWAGSEGTHLAQGHGESAEQLSAEELNLSSKPWVSMVVENVYLQKALFFFKKEKQLSRCFSPTKFLFQEYMWLTKVTTSSYQRLYYHLISKEKIKQIKIQCSDTSSTTTDVSEDPSKLQEQACNYTVNVENT